MKTNAIVRIVLFSIVIVVLLGILLACLAFGLYMFDGNTFVTTISDNQALPVAYEGESSQGIVDASGIRNIEVEWVSGSVTVLPDENTDQILIRETGVTNDKYTMVYRQNGETLKVQYCEDSVSFPSFGINAQVSKDLVITVPADWTCNTLAIDAASASVNISNLKINNVNFDGASGACKFSGCTVGSISMDTASGDVDFYGTLDVLDFDGASANCSILVSNVPQQIDIDTASGNLELYLPDECGFTCDMTTLSGSFSSDFEATNQNGHHVYGDGSCVIAIDAMSGDVCIRKHGSTAAFVATPDETISLCTDPDCTDAEHDHSHISSTESCTTENCTDESHGHTASHSGKHHD